MNTPPESSSPLAPDEPDDRIELTIHSDAAVVSVIGDYDLSHKDELSAALESAGAQPRVIVDLSRCTLLDSTGVAVLITARSDVGRLRLVIPPGGAVARVADLIRLADLVPISESLDEALAEPPA